MYKQPALSSRFIFIEPLWRVSTVEPCASETVAVTDAVAVITPLDGTGYMLGATELSNGNVLL